MAKIEKDVVQVTQQTLEMPLVSSKAEVRRKERLRDWVKGKVGLPSAVGSFPIKARGQEIKLSEQRGARNCQDFFDPCVVDALSYFGMHTRINAWLNTPFLV